MIAGRSVGVRSWRAARVNWARSAAFTRYERGYLYVPEGDEA
jgi:hypothetical protein